MDAKLDALLAAVARFREHEPGDVVSCLQRLPEPGALPSPWETWTLFGLVRHHKRQIWVSDLIRNRLQGSMSELAAMGSLGHPGGVPQSGPVPGMPEWEYYFHGRGCCISHKVDGDRIDVDFFDDSADYFDTYFYKNYLESLRRPEPPEQRLRELHPSAGAVTVAVTDLLAAGALTPLPGRDANPYRLADEVVAIANEMESLCVAWSVTSIRVWLAALIGDWLAADEAAAGRPELTAITGPRAGQCRETRQQRLRRDLGEQFRGPEALQALADLRSPDLDQNLVDALTGPPSGLISAALEIIGQQDDRRWCERVHELFSRCEPGGQMPQPYIWIKSLKFLLRHGHRTGELIGFLSEAGGAVVGEAVLLSLEHAPELALSLIRKALLADVPMDRIQVAATLALINAPWSKRELLGALKASDEQAKTADVRAALLECCDEELDRAVLDWEQRNPHEHEMGSYLEIGGRRLGPFYTFGELSLENRASWIKYEMGKLHERVMGIKNVVPPEPQPRSWWTFWRR